LGWIIVCLLDECIAISLAELAAKYPTSAGPYYWSYQICGQRYRTVLFFITGWTWLIGNWTISLSVNFGFASLLAATVNIYLPDYEWQPWKLVLICYALCIFTWFIVAFGNKFLPTVDTFCAAFTALTIVVACIWLSVTAKDGRHSAAYTLVRQDSSYAVSHMLTSASRGTKITACPAGATFPS
jgi:amino acid transporter